MNEARTGAELTERILQLIAGGESRTVEFKTSRTKLNRDLYETVCAFLNRAGGEILLGVSDSGELRGVDPGRIPQMRKDFVTAVSNPTNLSPPVHLDIQEVGVEDVTVLHIAVPVSSQVHRCGGKIYDRNEDGDFDITKIQSAVAQLYMRKENYHSENTVYPHHTLTDLRPELVARVRHVVGIRRQDHPWVSMDDSELLKSAKLILRDQARDVEGLTLAAILLFGKDDTILSVLPYHRTDAILRRVDVDRYDDRDETRTNLLDTYDRLIAFGEKHLNDPFYLEGLQRVSLRSHILREIVGNLLIHQEYSNAFPAKFVIERDRLFTENANRAHGHGRIDPARFTPFPKNPVIAQMFREIGLADELGSGVRKLYKYSKAYCGHDPELIEDDVFRLVLPLSEKTSEKGMADGLVERLVDGLAQSQREIMGLVQSDPRISKRDMAERIGISTTAVDKNIASLKKKGLLKRVGPDKGGHWKVLP